MLGDTLATRLGQLTSVQRQVEPTPSDVHELAVELVEQVSEATEAETNLATGPHVLLDVSVENLRCVVFVDDATEPELPTPFHLSPREREIARMIAEGYPNKTIAAVLEISCWTVNTHLRRMFAKCGVHSRAALIAKLLSASSTDFEDLVAD